MDKKKVIERFKNHKATFTDYGNIKVLDFEEPGRIEYRIRFLFEVVHYILHITGDLGELTASNYSNMTYEGFTDFVNNTGYFKEKIDCMNRPLYFWDENEARQELEKELEEAGYDIEEIESDIDDIMNGFDDGHGIAPDGQEKLENLISDGWEFAGELGKRDTGIIDIYMIAFKLAMKQLADAEGKVC